MPLHPEIRGAHPQEVQELCRQTELFVQATDEELEFMRHIYRSGSFGYPKIDGWPTPERRIDRMVELGTFQNRPIWINLTWERINGHLVAFYHPTGTLWDFKLAEQWLAFFPKAQHCYVTNFASSLLRLSSA